VDGFWDDDEDEVLQHAVRSAGEAGGWEADTLLAAFQAMTALATYNYPPAYNEEIHERIMQAACGCVACVRLLFSREP
jgi:hypothetical protein